MATLSIPISQNVFSAGHSSTGRRSSQQHHSALQFKCFGKNSLKTLFNLVIQITELRRVGSMDYISSIRLYSDLVASRDGSECNQNASQFKELRNAACGILAVWAVATVSPVIAANQVKIFKIPSFFSP